MTGNERDRSDHTNQGLPDGQQHSSSEETENQHMEEHHTNSDTSGDPIENSSAESFPASDPPSWTPERS